MTVVRVFNWGLVQGSVPQRKVGWGRAKQMRKMLHHITFTSILVMMSFTDKHFFKVLCSTPVFLLAHVTEWNPKAPIQFLSVFTQSQLRRGFVNVKLTHEFYPLIASWNKAENRFDLGSQIECRTVGWDMDFYWFPNFSWVLWSKGHRRILVLMNSLVFRKCFQPSYLLLFWGKLGALWSTTGLTKTANGAEFWKCPEEVSWPCCFHLLGKEFPLNVQ